MRGNISILLGLVIGLSEVTSQLGLGKTSNSRPRAAPARLSSTSRTPARGGGTTRAPSTRPTTQRRPPPPRSPSRNSIANRDSDFEEDEENNDSGDPRNRDGPGGRGNPRAEGQCTNPYVRKEIRDLSRQELRDFTAALGTMKRTGVFDRFCRIHLDNVPYAHATPYFLPWHREFIFQFERELKRINPGLNLPYWDWSIDSQAPERSIILSSQMFGSQGGRCIDDGPFSGWQCDNPDEHCLGRSYDGGDTIGAFYSPELLSFTLDRRRDYDDFRTAIEGPPHGNVHNNIGGDMSTMGSCNDPLFYLHHGMIDKLWLTWQRSNPRFVMDFSGSYNGQEATLDDDLVPFDKVVGDVMDVDRAYCYTYGDEPTVPRRRNPPPSRRRRNRRAVEDATSENTASAAAPGVDPHDREDMNKLRAPEPLPLSFIRMFNLSETKVRQQEKQNKEEIDRLNLSGYVSKVALGVNGLLLDGANEIANIVNELVTGGSLKKIPEKVIALPISKKKLVGSNNNILTNLLI